MDFAAVTYEVPEVHHANTTELFKFLSLARASFLTLVKRLLRSVLKD